MSLHSHIAYSLLGMDTALIGAQDYYGDREEGISQSALRSRRGFLEGEVDPGKAVMG